MKNVPVEQKKEAGQLLNELNFLQNHFINLTALWLASTAAEKSTIDISLRGQPLPLGTRHPISIVHNKIVSIFQRLGFSIAEGPEIEDDWHNFTALNLPEQIIQPEICRILSNIRPESLIGFCAHIPAVFKSGRWKKVNSP
jgi:phenylalanyl-tRNA synthetase alpha chain